jgi:hypothetical protein
VQADPDTYVKLKKKKYWNPKNKKKRSHGGVDQNTDYSSWGFFCWISPIYFEMIKIEHRA